MFLGEIFKMPRYEKDDLSLSPYYRLTKKEAKQRYDEMYSLIKDLAPNFIQKGPTLLP